LGWRAVTDTGLQTAAYWMIIGWEVTTAVVLWAGVARLLGSKSASKFSRAKATAVFGLVLGFVLYAVGFIAIGGEWFAMWQSQAWNGQQKAFEFLTMISAVLIILLIPETEETI
jgi:predicted small integral membrane protein